ncbi:MAG: hypothetical protein ACO3RV_00825, partial [Luteolibacter sp.]
SGDSRRTQKLSSTLMRCDRPRIRVMTLSMTRWLTIEHPGAVYCVMERVCEAVENDWIAGRLAMRHPSSVVRAAPRVRDEPKLAKRG